MPIIAPQQGSPLNDWVPADGPKDAPLVLIGEAPASVEVRTKVPFSGPAGTVLNECLQAARIIRRDCRITNVFKRPVVKASGKWKIDGAIVYIEGTGFTEAGKVWVERLREELKETPGLLVPMGNAALQAILGFKGILRYRGSILPTDFTGGIRKTVPTIHPAATIERRGGGGLYIHRYFIIHDLRRAMAESAEKEFKYPDCQFILKPSFHEVMDILTTYKQDGKRRAWDIEVYNQEASCVGVGTKDQVLVVPFTDGREHYWTLEEEAQVWLKIASILEDPNIEKIFQNGMFDTWFLLHKNNIITQGPLHDTMVAWKLCFPDDGFKKSLDVIASVFTRWPFYKDEFKLWTSRALQGHTKGNMQILWEYNAKDVAATDEALYPLLEELEKQNNMDTYLHTMKLYPALLYMMTRGIQADRTKLAEVKVEINARIDALQAELEALAGRPLNPLSHVQLKQYFYVEKGIKPYINPKTKAMSVDDNALKRMCKATTTRPAIKEAQLIREIRSLSKLRGTYLDIEFDPDNRLRCSINPVGTKNGRLSTSQTIFGTGTNMQNLPQQFKRFLVADKDNVLIELDKAQGEWVIVAFVSGDANMMEVARSGEDAHVATGHLAFHVPKDLIKKESKIVGNETDPVHIKELREKFVPDILKYAIPGSMSVRQAGKKSNHALNYDMQYKKFALVNEVPENESKVIVAAYHRGYVGIKLWHQWVVKELSRSRTLENVFGRRRRFYDRWSDEMFRDGYAFNAQSTLVDLLNRSIIKIYNDHARYLRPMDMQMQVHDSLLFQWLLKYGRYNRLARAVWKMCEHMDPTLMWQGREFHIRTDMKMGLNWAAYNRENPIGMMEIPISQNLEEFAERLYMAHRTLRENEANL